MKTDWKRCAHHTRLGSDGKPAHYRFHNVHCACGGGVSDVDGRRMMGDEDPSHVQSNTKTESRSEKQAKRGFADRQD